MLGYEKYYLTFLDDFCFLNSDDHYIITYFKPIEMRYETGLCKLIRYWGL